MLSGSTYQGKILNLRIAELQIAKLRKLQENKGFLTLAAAARYAITNFREAGL